MVNNGLKTMQNWLYPPRCLLCGDPGDGDMDLCVGCVRSLPYLAQACSRCALPLASPGDDLICGGCLKTPPAYDKAIALFHYEQPVNHLIQTLKFGGHLAVARTLGRLLAERLQNHQPHPDVLVPVPLHPHRYRERGFNQSAEIAAELSRYLAIPMNATLCQRVRHTPAQAGLVARERRINLKGAFRVSRENLPAHIAIVDDVVTTGTTVNELARTLHKAGVKRIQVWSLARVDSV